jgi:predicted DNA-binding WGR domain protein
MSQHRYHQHLRRIDTSKNMARFYEMQIGTSLFGDVSLTRRWGRIGTRGQSRVHLLENENAAVAMFLAILRQKQLRGYRG